MDYYMKANDEFKLTDGSTLKIVAITIHMPTRSPRVTYFHDAGQGVTSVNTVTVAGLLGMFPELVKIYIGWQA